MDTALPAKDHANDSAQSALRDLIGQLQDGVFQGAVDKDLPKRIANHHDDGAYRDTDPGGEPLLSAEGVMGDQGDNHRLQPVRYQRNEHGQGVEQEIAQKGSDPANDKSFEWV